MHYFTVLTIVGLGAIQALAASSTTTKTTSYSYPNPDPKSTQYVGLLQPTASANEYGTVNCEGSSYITSGNYFQCDDKTASTSLATSCGGSKPSIAGPGWQQACPAKATCVTDTVYDNKDKKHAVTGYFCATTSRDAQNTLYRSNPPELINGKPSGASSLGGEYVTVGALFAGFFTLGMAIML